MRTRVHVTSASATGSVAVLAAAATSNAPVTRIAKGTSGTEFTMTLLFASVVLLTVLGTAYPASTGCKNCITLGKEEKAMFRAHSDACLPQSGVDPKLVEGMLNGELSEDTALKRHVYCVLLKCKVISKDGKLQKTAVMGKMANRADGKNATKVLESCAEQSGDTPEEIAWNLFRCGFDKKAVLFEFMPTNIANSDIENNS